MCHNASVSSPYHSLAHPALCSELGARSSEYVFGRVLKEEFMRSLHVSHSGHCVVPPYALERTSTALFSRLEHLDVRPRDVGSDWRGEADRPGAL
eukprot:1409251-Prymnesium_polylepis.1